MNFLEQSASTLLQRFRAELILIAISLGILVLSLVFFTYISGGSRETEITFSEHSATEEASLKGKSKKSIFVDISGSVKDPDVYKLSYGSRLKDVLVKAGGLSAKADREFFARHFNLARIVKDEEKIYIPSKKEVKDINTQSSIAGASTETVGSLKEDDKSKININTASESELDSLPGIGPVTAGKIISNRPYSSIEELLSKKAVNKGQYGKIKDLVDH